MGKNYNSSRLVNGLSVDASGNVGVGGSPSTKFQVTGTIGNFQIASSGAEIFLTRNENNDILATGGTSSGITFGAQSFLKFKVGTSYTERMIINSSGNVGIGTSNPNSKLELAISSTNIIQFGTGVVGSSGQYVGGLYYSSNKLSIQSFLVGTGYQPLLLAPDGGNVGIGISSPTYKLETLSTSASMAAFATTSASGGFLQFRYNTSSVFGYIGTGNQLASGSAVTDFAIANDAGNIVFSTGGSFTERMRITSGGAVFINTTTDPGASARLGIVNGFGMEGLCVKMGSTGAYSPIAVRDTTGAEMFNIRENGAMDNPYAYNTTTGSAANVFVNTIGRFLRSSSSLKYKTDVRDYDKGLAEVMQIRPVYYKGKSEDDGDTQFAGLIAEEIHDLGLTEFVQYANDGTPDALAYQNMVALLTKAIQELKEENDDLRSILNRNNLQ
jgi:hypothetical protein